MSPSAKKSFFGRILRFFKWIFYTILVGTVLTVGGGIGLYLYFSKDLPKLYNIQDYNPPVMSEVFDDSGKVKIGEFWKEARILTPIKKVPKKMIEAMIASEDDRFFEHVGIDVYGIARAFWRNLQAGQVVEGASTITQQVTRALLLTPERSYVRKIKEAILATRLEKNLTKDQILYIYLNHIYLGNRAYGVAAAARNYFDKDLKDLNLAETAMVAGLAKAPSLYNPIVNPTRAKQRMLYVLDRMQQEGYATTQEIQQAKNFGLKVFKAGTDKDFNIKHAPYFVEHVRRRLQKKYGDKLYTGGWNIHTTVNLKMYRDAQRAVTDGLKKYAKRYGFNGPIKELKTPKAIKDFLKQVHLRLYQEKFGRINYFKDPKLTKAMSQATPIESNRLYQAVVTNVPSSGLEVKVGNRVGLISAKDVSWSKRPAFRKKRWEPKAGDVIEVKLKKGSGGISPLAFTLEESPQVQAALYSYEPFTGAIRAIIGGEDYRKSEFNRATQALRQPGSAIKPFVYAAALDKGYTTATTIMDSPIAFEESPGKFWKPKNAGGRFHGPTAFRAALIASRNVVTVRILMDIGTHYVTGFLRKVGLTTPIYKYYSMALGSNEVRLDELARAFGIFVTGGILPKTHFVKKILDPQGKVVEEYTPIETPYLVSYKIKSEKKAPKESTKTKDKKKDASKDSSEKKKMAKDDTPKAKPHKDLYEMDYNSALFEASQEDTKKDDLILTHYEKKLLYGSYIPEGYTISPRTALTIIKLLQGVVSGGTGRRALALNRPTAGKTGTTNRSTDAWFMGLTPNLITGVWVGFDAKIRSIGYGAQGGRTALPIWLEYMKKAIAKYPVTTFTNTKKIDLALYKPPVQIVTGIGFEDQWEEDKSNVVTPGQSGSSSSAEFFSQDLE